MNKQAIFTLRSTYPMNNPSRMDILRKHILLAAVWFNIHISMPSISDIRKLVCDIYQRHQEQKYRRMNRNKADLESSQYLIEQVYNDFAG